jgi:hypothetical protein
MLHIIRRLVPVLVLLALMGVGLLVVIAGVQSSIEIHDQRSWLTAEGSIVESPAGRISYEYAVDGVAHRATQYRDSDYKEYPPGKIVTVYYSPQDVDRSIVVEQNYAEGVFPIMFGVVLMLFCSPFVLFFGALAYAEILLVKARYHCRQAMQAIEEGDEHVSNIDDELGYVPEDLAVERQAAAERAAVMEGQLRDMEDWLHGDDDGEASEQHEELPEPTVSIISEPSGEDLSAAPIRAVLDTSAPSDQQLVWQRPVTMAVDQPALKNRPWLPDWRPGIRVELVRPAIPLRFVLLSAVIFWIAAAAGLYWFIHSQKWPLTDKLIGCTAVGALIGAVIAIYLQGLHPRRHCVLDWKTGKLTVTIQGKSTSYILSRLMRLIVRRQPHHAQLDAEFPSGAVFLFDSDDHGRASLSVPLDQVGPLAQELGEALNIPCERGTTRVEPFSALRVWRQSSLAARLALVTAVSPFLIGSFGLFQNPILRFVTVSAGAISIIAGPVGLGIALGVRMVAAGRRSLANLLGCAFMVVGGLTFGWTASRNQQGLWDEVAGGKTIAMILTFIGMTILLFGLGVVMRHSRKGDCD